MATVDIGTGPLEFRCTAWTCVVYEQEFLSDKYEGVTGDIIRDAVGKLVVGKDDLGYRLDENGDVEVVIFNYTHEDWNVLRRALWAMLKTQDDILTDKGVQHQKVPSYKEWCRTLLEVEPDMREVSMAVGNELQRGLFRAGAAASGKTSHEEG